MPIIYDLCAWYDNMNYKKYVALYQANFIQEFMYLICEKYNFKTTEHLKYFLSSMKNTFESRNTSKWLPEP